MTIEIGDLGTIIPQDTTNGFKARWRGLRVRVENVGLGGSPVYFTPLSPRPDPHGTHSFYWDPQDFVPDIKGDNRDERIADLLVENAHLTKELERKTGQLDVARNEISAQRKALRLIRRAAYDVL